MCKQLYLKHMTNVAFITSTLISSNICEFWLLQCDQFVTRINSDNLQASFIFSIGMVRFELNFVISLCTNSSIFHRLLLISVSWFSWMFVYQCFFICVTSSLFVFTWGQFWPSVIVVACVVHPSVHHQVCPRYNSSPVQARLTKFGPKMQNALLKVPIVLRAIHLDLQGQI